VVGRTIERPQDVRRAQPATDIAATAALRDAGPVIAGLAPLGLALGTTIAEARVANVTGWLSAPLIYGASPQLAAVTMLGAGAAGLSIVATIAVINLRALFYSAGLRDLFRGQPLWFRVVGAYLLVDPLFALVGARRYELRTCSDVRRYYLVAGLAIWAAWLPLVAAGIVLGPALPAAETLRFAMPALLVGLLVPAVHGRPAMATVAVSAALVVAVGPLGGAGLLAAGVGGAAAGILVESRRL
jgi:predicted branched-subunit amino acid permease